jgi:Na+(H+)/acetate symporter ActP
MQALILFVGVLVFVFYQFNAPPLFFNESELVRAAGSSRGGELRALEAEHADAFARKRAELAHLATALDSGDRAAVAAAEQGVRTAAARADGVHARAQRLLAAGGPRAEAQDGDYVFLSFVMTNLPRGLVGLLLAVIFCAAMSSTASELTALAQCSLVDFYRRSVRPDGTDAHYLRVAKVFTAAWGALSIVFALGASMLDNLIQAVNILGSLFYGPILGIFLVAFFVPKARATPVFVAAIVGEAVVFALWLATSVGFLWFNVVGCAVVVALGAASAVAARR